MNDLHLMPHQEDALIGKGETIADMRRAEKTEAFLKKVEMMRKNGTNETAEGQIHRCS